MELHVIMDLSPDTQSQERDWDALFEELLPRVYNFFRFRTGEDALAEDLTASTFIKAWRARGSYDPQRAAVSTWLFAIARNVAADYFRSHHDTLSLDTLATLPTSDNLEAGLETRLDYERLTVLLDALPPRERELVALRYGAEMTYQDIAQLTGLTQANVGTILHRTVHRLRSQWDRTS
jgi:RNA polymerase sigma-70 factor, ECF subfamily